MNGEASAMSRNGSVSSRGSVRITITNLAETNGNIDDLDSPGSYFIMLCPYYLFISYLLPFLHFMFFNLCFYFGS